MKAINRDQLFTASRLSLFVTSSSSGIKAGTLSRVDVQLNFDTA